MWITLVNWVTTTSKEYYIMYDSCPSSSLAPLKSFDILVLYKFDYYYYYYLSCTVPDTLESSDSDGDVILLVLQIVQCLHHGAISRRSDRSDRLTESDVWRHRLQKSVVRSDLARIQHQRLAEKVLVAVAEQTDFLGVCRRKRRGHRRLGRRSCVVYSNFAKHLLTDWSKVFWSQTTQPMRACDSYELRGS